MTAYHVTATRWEHGWELDIEGVGVTQARNLAEVQLMVTDYLRLDLGAAAVREAEVTVEVIVDGLQDEVERVRAEIEALGVQQAQVAHDSRAVARKLKAAGLTGADTARVMGVSPQRVSQLINA